MARNVVIMGAAGRDFHDFNSVFRGDDRYEVVAFTQAAGQNIGELDDLPERVYPPELAGDGYPDGIPIRPEADLEAVIEEYDADEVVLSYSDLSHEAVMHRASRVLAAGADFRLVGTEMMLDADVPVVAVDAVRTGCGKSQTSRKIAGLLAERGKRVVVVREPMPYGDLREQAVQRFASYDDLAAAGVTIEEREEFEQHVEAGHVVYAGVDYEAILREAEQEADVIVWDGGNNELPFFRPDVHFVLVDPHRPGHELTYHPGETNLRLADYVVVNKENTADPDDIRTVEANVASVNPDAEILHADSTVSVEDPAAIEGKRVLAVEDGPTLTHGGTAYGAATIAAEQFGAAEIVDPRDAAVGSIAPVYEKYPHLGDVLPAMGYNDRQIADLEATIRNVDCDVVLVGTPFDLSRLIDVDMPTVRVRYEIDEKGTTLSDVLDRHADVLGL
ncbi:cyclic 2,3-diphosphoglycerate synthase [Halobacteriaceae archaeon GCM10025711]